MRRALLVLSGVLLGVLCAEAGLRAALVLWRGLYRGLHREPSFTLFVVGESTAYGVPFAPKISMPVIVAHHFGNGIKGKPVAIVSLASPGSVVEEQYWSLFREWALRPRKDAALLVYAGINDAQEPRQSSGRSLGQRLATGSIVLSRVAVLVKGFRWRGLGADYELYLDKILVLARSCGVPVVVSTLAGNIRDFPPPPDQGPGTDPAKVRRLAAGLELERRGRPEAAAAVYREVLAGSPADASVLHRLAGCLLRLGRADEAGRLYREAADLGGALMPTSRQNQAIRRLASLRGASLTDTLGIFERASKHGLPGNDLFMDAHHPNLKGYLLLCAGFAERLEPLLAEPRTRLRITPEELMKATGFSSDDVAAAHRASAMWLLGEASVRKDREELVRLAREHLALAEAAAGGRVFAAHRLLAALLAGDEAEVRRWLARKDLLRRDRDMLAAIGVNRDWLKAVIEAADLSGSAGSAAGALAEEAAALTLGAGAGQAVPVRPLSKRFADRGVRAVLSGHDEVALREFWVAVLLDSDNAEAYLARCSLLSGMGRLDEAVLDCDRAVSIAESGRKSYPLHFLGWCRSARDRASEALRSRSNMTRQPLDIDALPSD